MTIILLLCLTPCFAAPSWHRLQSSHFELLTDAGEKRGAAILRQLEQFRRVFVKGTGRESLQPLPVRVFAFSSVEAYRLFRAKDNAAGYYQSGPDRDYIVMQIAGPEWTRIIFHEYVHLLLHHTGAELPVWFSEGLAEFYSTMDIRKGQLRVGADIPVHLTTLGAEKLLDLETLFAVEQNSPWYNERDKSGLFYAQSWALIHMMHFDPRYRTGNAAQLLQQVLRYPVSSLQAALVSYIDRRQYSTARLSSDPVLLPLTTVAERLSSMDTCLAQVDLLLALHRPDPAEALLQTIGDPQNPTIEAALGDVALQRKQDQLAQQHYERAMSLGSRDWRVSYHLALLVREARGPVDRVIALLREAVSLSPTKTEARYLLDQILTKEEVIVRTPKALPKTDVNKQQVSGLLTQVDCLGDRARLRISFDKGHIFLLVRDPNNVLLRNARGPWTEFACGELNQPRKVKADFERDPSETYGTTGVVTALEFQ
ncbi:MAG: hypothetical protein H7039_16955 [Bryobacteraceae bacterium]|nr:hypothetical protein [Bryobacteraceae bacterium]